MVEHLPQGYQWAGVHSGVKKNPQKQDFSLIISDRPATAAGVFTQNLVCAAPVKLCRQRVPGAALRAVVINSGNANACTGDQGDRDAAETAGLVGTACDVDPHGTLVLSTGVIGRLMPMDKIAAGVSSAADELGTSLDHFERAARGMMTTDTHPKMCSRRFEIDGVPIVVAGMAKGAAMIGPNLATMLAVICTDANLAPADAQAGLKDAADESFNCISVEGHTSTNDSVVLLANGAAGGPRLAGSALARFQATLVEVCEELAIMIPSDGEGATHLITVEVHGCRTRADAVKIAKTIADSPLVKTAITGHDPNWGRIVSAAGYAGVEFDPAKVSLLVNGSLLYEHGAPVAFDAATISASMKADRNCGLVLILEEGDQSARFWTSDLTAEYVRLNADYTT